MHALIGEELSRMRAAALRADARPRRRRPVRATIRRSVGAWLVEAGVRLMGTREVAG